jgi:hypothetical protein
VGAELKTKPGQGSATARAALISLTPGMMRDNGEVEVLRYEGMLPSLDRKPSQPQRLEHTKLIMMGREEGRVMGPMDPIPQTRARASEQSAVEALEERI